MLTHVLDPPLVRHHACTRANPVVHARDDCRRCQRACPKAAIALDPLAVDPEACDGCGLCLPTCPTAALTPNPTVQRHLMATFDGVKPTDRVVISCERAPDDAPAPDLGVRCLAALPWPVLAAPLVAGARRVALHSGDCGGCVFEHAMPELDRQVALAAAALGRREAFERISGPPREASKPDLSRRGFLGGLFQKGHVAAMAATELAAQAVATRLGLDAAAETHGAWLQRWLGSMLAEHDPAAVFGPRAGAFATPRIDGEACDGCGLCGAACPAGALAEHAEPDPARVSLDPADCTSCGVCVPACEAKALTLDAGIGLGDWPQGRREIARAAARRCRACGRPALSAALPWCPTCYRMRPPTAR